MSLRKTILGCAVLLGCVQFVGADIGISSNAPPAQSPHFTLWQSLDLALKQNPDVLVAKKKIEEAVGGVIEARAGFLPSLTTWDNYQWFSSSYATLNGAMPNDRPFIWNVSVRLTETAYAGGAVRGRMSIARLTKESHVFDYQATVNRVLMDVRIAFYDVLRTRAGVAVHQQSVNFLQKQLQYERQRIEIGSGQKLNALRAEVELSLEQSALIESQNLARNAMLLLGELMSVPQTAGQTKVPFTVEGQLDTPPFALPEEECMVSALEHRPELRARDDDTEVQKKQLIVDRSAILPRVSLFAGYDVVSEPDRSLPDSFYNGYTAGVGVTWNIFDGFAARGRMRATRARIDQAEITRSALNTSVRAEVARAFHDLQRAGETVRSQRENMDLASQSLSLATANFQEGLITQLDLLQSQLDLSRAQTVELNARFDYNAALARLQRAMGAEFNFSTGKEAK